MVTTGQSGHYTSLALETFLKHTELQTDDLFYLVDNDCEYELPEHLNFAQLRILRNRRPTSLARNLNRIFTKALSYTADVVLLKNDTVFTRGWFNPLRSQSTMIVAALTNHELQYECNEINLTTSYSYADFKKQEQLIPELIAKHQERTLGLHSVLAVPFISCRIPYTILKQVGFLDENYGLGGGEDFDYCLRAHLEGFSVAYAADAYVIHFGGDAQWNNQLSRRDKIRNLADATDRFICQWGIPLTDLIMRKNTRIIMKNPALKQAIQDQRHADIVFALAEGSHWPENQFAPPDDILKVDAVAAL